MEKLYCLFALLYAVIQGGFDVAKKKAVQKSNELSILVIFTGVSFACSLIWLPFGVCIPVEKMSLFVIKGFILAVNWFVILRLISNTDVSLIALTTVLSSVITFIVGVMCFGETATTIQYLGVFIIIFGAVLINFTNKREKGLINIKSTILLMLSAVISAASAVIDKYSTQTLSAPQVQFWFLFFNFLFSCGFFAIECIKNKKVMLQKSDFKNYWIYLVGVILFLGDMFLFLSYKMPGSKMILITAISKLKVVIAVLLGVVLFKEKNISKKILISLMVFVGILLVSL